MSRTYTNVNGTGISTHHLSQNPALYEPSRNNAFEFILDLSTQPIPNTLISAGVNAAIAESPAENTDDYLNNVSDIIRISVAESSIPHFDLGVIEVRRGNSTMKFAGTPTFSEGSIKCNDYVGARTKDVLLAWQRMAYDVVNDVVELAGNYKRTCKLVEYTPDFAQVLRTWTLYGCWVRTLSEGNFSHESSDKRSIDVTIVFDRAVPEFSTPVTEADQ